MYYLGRHLNKFGGTTNDTSKTCLTEPAEVSLGLYYLGRHLNKFGGTIHDTSKACLTEPAEVS